MRLLWAFIVVVTVLDIEFAIKHADSMQIWEANPVMRLVVARLGVQVACCIRMASVMFACSLCLWCKSRVGKFATVFVLALHLYLAATYVAILWL